MKEDRRFIDNAQSLKPFLAKVQKIGKKTAKKTSAVDQEWQRVVPAQWHNFTSVAEFRDNRLTITVANPALRSELEMIKNNIIANLNSGQIVFVRELLFKVG